MEFAISERRTILFVEDGAELRALVVMLFEESDLEIVSCDSAESALATMLLRVRNGGFSPMFDFPAPSTVWSSPARPKVRWPHLTVVSPRETPAAGPARGRHRYAEALASRRDPRAGRTRKV